MTLDWPMVDLQHASVARELGMLSKEEQFARMAGYIIALLEQVRGGGSCCCCCCCAWLAGRLTPNPEKPVPQTWSTSVLPAACRFVMPSFNLIPEAVS